VLPDGTQVPIEIVISIHFEQKDSVREFGRVPAAVVCRNRRIVAAVDDEDRGWG
jgi:hypothetical protein